MTPQIPLPDLPITEALPRLLDALRARGLAVLQAPPGAGKTTCVPLAILGADLRPGRILMLEPRRLAARSSAERMAETLGEAVGQTVGYRVRGDARVSAQTRIEVVTEGILTRMIQSDPGLDGIDVLIFDEFHERSLHADLGLALALELRAALREDLVILVMSATLDAAPVAALMGDAPLITSEGRAFPVETRWLPRPLPSRARLEVETATLILQALEECPEGGLLAFLPGEGEIRRTEAALNRHLPPGCTIRPLFGAMSFADQRAALTPQTIGRKIVLATAIAETSLTLPDIRVVVDTGRARRARFDPNSGMSRLVTERVTKAEAEQRRGRAGRVAPGTCYRLWTKGEEGGMSAFPPAEIEAADLTPLALELALWGSDEGLSFLTPPNPGVLAEARALLTSLGALVAGRITDHGRALAALPLHPRLGHMLLCAGESRDAATLAALLAERDPLRGAPPDLSLRLAALVNPAQFEESHPWRADRPTIERIRTEAQRLTRTRPRAARDRDRDLTAGQLAALAYPDRIALRRKGDAPRYVLSGGKGAVMDDGTPLDARRYPLAGTRPALPPRWRRDARHVRYRSARQRRNLAAALSRRPQDRRSDARPRPDRCPARPAGVGRHAIARPPDPLSFSNPAGSPHSHRLFGRGPGDRTAPSRTVRHYNPPHCRPQKSAPAHHPLVPRPQAGPSHDGPARFLDQQLQRCPQGHAGSLPAPPLARRPARSRPDFARQTTRHLKTAHTHLFKNILGGSDLPMANPCGGQTAPRPG